MAGEHHVDVVISAGVCEVRLKPATNGHLPPSAGPWTRVLTGADSVVSLRYPPRFKAQETRGNRTHPD